MWGEWLRSGLGFGFKGLPVGVDCDDELMIEVVMVCAVLVLEGGKDAIFFWCQCPCFVINVHIWTSNVHVLLRMSTLNKQQ